MTIAQQELGIYRAWSTTFYTTVRCNHAVEAPALIAFLKSLEAQEGGAIASGIAVAAKANLYESNFDLFRSDHPSIVSLVSFIDETVRVAISHINGSEKKPEELEVSFDDSWCHITNQGGFHDAHYHSGCSWCGIYYVQIGESSMAQNQAPNGASRFYTPIPTGGRPTDYGNHYRKDATITPPIEDGLLILFPSYLLHSGLPYRGESDRIVIAFNARVSVRK